MNRLRIIVAEDSTTVRKRRGSELPADPQIEVIGEAVDGREALELCLLRRPDASSA